MTGGLSFAGSLAPLAASAGMATIVCASAERTGRWLGVMDEPDGERKDHAHPTPLLGGLAVMLPTLFVAAALAHFTEYGPFYLTIFCAGAGCLLLGMLDDRRHIRASLRLGLSFLICVAAILAVPGFQVTFFNFSFLNQALFLDGRAFFFSLMCLVGLQNAVNMADGKNGLVIGLSLIWCLALIKFAPPHLAPLLLAFAAGLSVTFAFNLAGRLFLGDSGSYAISLLVGLAVIYVHSVGFVRLPADLVALWFLVPVLDCLRLMVRRITIGVSPFAPDRNHLHHILDRQLPWRWGLVIYLALVGGPSFAAIAAPRYTLTWGVIVAVCYVVILATGLRQRQAVGAHSH